MNKRGAVVLGLAILCGLGAMFGVKKVLAKKGGEGIRKVEVLVAVREIAVEETLTDEMMSLKAVPADLVPPGVLIDLKDARGRWARIRLLPGDPILDAKLAPKGTPTGLIGKITPGMRAVTIRVDEQTGLSGFILPDYRVDVHQPKRDDRVGRVARVLLQNVRVLASGTVIESPDDRSIKSETVTLEVTPAQAELLTAAAHEGPLSLSLRPLGDASIVESETPLEPEPAAPPPAPEPVLAVAPSPKVEPARALPSPPREISRLVLFRGRRAKPDILGTAPPAEDRRVTVRDQMLDLDPDALAARREENTLPTRPPSP